MPSNKQPDVKKREKSPPKEWTLMVFCAGDNALSPMIVSQLKDLKDAGGHDDVNVLVYFDANERGIPTRLYSINKHAHRNGYKNGHNNGNGHNGNRHYGHLRPFDTYVQNLASDKITINPKDGPAAEKLERLLNNPNNHDDLHEEPHKEPQAIDALSAFIAYCLEQHKAKHYALLLVGHGMIVANDEFLPDEFPDSSITLKQLGETVKGFRGKLELLALHSCSMSAIEVAYELKGKAKYMIASEGPAYVQGWPYRKLLGKAFELLNYKAQNGHGHGNGNGEQQTEFYVRVMVEELYKLCSSNGLDFMLSGYSQDLALINLEEDKFPPLTKAIKRLVFQLKSALKKDSGKQLIQLAHLESQSYYNESYTDLYDFCFCLTENCKSGEFPKLIAACEKVMEVLDPSDRDGSERFNNIVVHSRHFGSQYQYSHGLSVYFPWSKPMGDAKGSVLGRYNGYKFTTDFKKDDKKDNSWLSFLKFYLEETERKPRKGNAYSHTISRQLSRYRAAAGELAPDPNKTSGSTGASCSCVSIKNYPTEPRKVRLKGKNCWTRALTMNFDPGEAQPHSG
jgi:Clostripain family